jgi:hypothetical protein
MIIYHAEPNVKRVTTYFMRNGILITNIIYRRNIT